MSRKNNKIQATITLEDSLASNFLRLCDAEGVDSENAYRELERRLEALGQLKLSRARN